MKQKKEIRPYTHRAQYYETDQMGFVHHSNYIRWFEEARCDFMEQMGMGYREMEEAGILSPVLAVQCEYKASVYFRDVVEIRLKIKAYNGIKLTIGYEITDQATGELRTTGETRHCFLDRQGKLLSLKRAHAAFHQMFLLAYGWEQEAEGEKESRF